MFETSTPHIHDIVRQRRARWPSVDPALYQCTWYHWTQDVLATLNQRHWRWFNVATTPWFPWDGWWLFSGETLVVGYGVSRPVTSQSRAHAIRREKSPKNRWRVDIGFAVLRIPFFAIIISVVEWLRFYPSDTIRPCLQIMFFFGIFINFNINSEYWFTSLSASFQALSRQTKLEVGTRFMLIEWLLESESLF